MRYRACVSFVCVITAAAPVIRGQSPAFDVASVKVNHSGAQSTRIAAPRGTGRLDVTNAMVHTLILNAFALQDFQLAGGPAWIRDTRFDIAARTNSGASREDVSAMLRSLLANRFHLKTHREPREMPTYALMLAREGRLGPDHHRQPIATHDLQLTFTPERASGPAGGPGGPPADANARSIFEP